MLTRAFVCLAGKRVPPTLVSEFVQVCASNDFGRMQACVTNLVQEGYSAAQLVSQVSRELARLRSKQHRP